VRQGSRWTTQSHTLRSSGEDPVLHTARTWGWLVPLTGRRVLSTAETGGREGDVVIGGWGYNEKGRPSESRVSSRVGGTEEEVEGNGERRLLPGNAMQPQ